MRSERREQAACDALRTFVRDLHLYRFGAAPTLAEETELVLRLKAKPGDTWELRFDPPLADQLTGQIEDVQAGRNVFRQGRLYCFRCDSSECEHSVPPSPLAVFDGYEPNGLPEWREFAQVLIVAKDARVDRLFEKAPGILTVLRLGHDLRTRQLSSFGRSSKTYAVLGQVVAGYFLLPRNGSEAAERLAITFQAVETRDDRGARLQLNAVAGLPSDEKLVDVLASGWQEGLHRAREIATRGIERIEQLMSAARERGDAETGRQALRQIPGIMRRLAESVERGYRQETRRTRHVEQRRHERRPVHKALEELMAAAVEDFFFDEKTGTTIVCGSQGRAHVFSSEGRHVTSFLLRPGSVDFRLRTQRWCAIPPAEAAAFRLKVESFLPAKDAASNT